MSFSNDIRRWKEQTKSDLDAVVGDIFRTLAVTIVNRTPVGDWSMWSSTKGKRPSGDYRPGTLVNNWFSSIAPPSGLALREHNVNGATSLANIDKIAPKVSGNIVYFVNPTPYANRIEYGGHSQQAPQGMVRITVKEFKGIVKAVVNGVRQN